MKKLLTAFCAICLATTVGWGVSKPLTADAAENMDEITVDFATNDGDIFTEYSGGGWTVKNGKYYPANASAITKTAKDIDLTGTTCVSFDFYATSAPFDFVLLTDINNGWSGGLGFHLYQSPYQTITVNNNVDQVGWIGDCTVYANALVDRRAHNLKIKIADGKASFYVDGETTAVGFNGGALTEIELSSATLGTSLGESAQIIFRAADTTSYIDNFKVSNSDIDYVAPEQSDDSYTELSLNFSDNKHASYFSGVGTDGFRIDGGRYYPKVDAEKTILAQAVQKDRTTYIAFEYYIAKNSKAEEENTYFTVAYLPDKEGEGVGVGLHNVFIDGQASVTVNEGIATNGYFGKKVFAWNDGKVHSVKIKISEGRISYYLDGETVDFGGETGTEISVPFENKGYLFFTASNTMSWIDNVVVSSDDIPYVPATQDDTPAFTEIETDFEDASLFTADGNGGWIASENSLKPAKDWAVTYLANKIPFAEAKTIAVDFTVSGGQGTQLNIGFRTEIGEGISSGVSLHFYKPTSDNQQLTLSYWFGNPFETTQAIYTEKGFIDGEKHTLKMIIKENTLAVIIDGTIVFKDFAMNSPAGYFTVQSSVAEASLSNLKIVNKAESLSPPDASEDITYPPSSENVADSTGTLTDKPISYNHTYITLTIVFGALAVVGIAATIVLWKKKEKNIKGEKKNETEK